MGLNTLNTRSAGETITSNFFNDLNQAVNGDMVGRNTSGVPTAGQNLGTAGVPFGTIRGTNLVINGSAVDTSAIVAPANRVVSGKTRATSGSNLNQYLVPNGAALSFVVDGTPTNLVVVINSATVTVAADLTKSGLTSAPAANNTALIDDAAAASQYDTRFWGSTAHRKVLTIDTAGTEITGLVGKWAAFKLAGTTDEYFLAFVKSATELTNCYRGYFYDSTLAPVKATTFSDNAVITLMKLTWVFIENDASTVDVTYTTPVWAFTSPSAPSAGDYWYDLANGQWNRHDGATFQVINRTYVGVVISDSANTVAARCEDSYALFKNANSFAIEKATSEIARATNPGCSVNVAGFDINYGEDRPTWNITTDLAATADMYNATEQTDRFYYLYIKQNGDTVMSDIFPYLRAELQGWYHPYNIWRCVGITFNDSASDLQTASAVDTQVSGVPFFKISTGNGYGSANTKQRRYSVLEFGNDGATGWVDSGTDGSKVNIGWPGRYTVDIGELYSNTATAHGYVINSSNGAVDISSGGGFDVQYITATADSKTRRMSATILLYLGDDVSPRTDGLSNNTSSYVFTALSRGNS